MSKIKVAVLGYGHLGKWHAQKVEVLEQSELVAIVEPFEASQKIARQNHPDVKIVSNIADVINEIDAAIIVTPTSTHFELTKLLLEEEKHVFCEKPLCSTFEQAHELREYLTDDLILQVGHSERCHAAWGSLEDYFKEINSHFSVKLNRVAEFKGRATDVDVVQDLMIHDLDLLLYLLEKKPSKLKAFGHKIRTDKWDSVTCLLEYEDGSHAKITSGRNHVKEIRSFEVMHDGGCLFVDLFANEYSIGSDSQFDDGEYVKSYKYEKRDHLLIEQDNFYNAIVGKEKPMVNYEDGAAIVYVIDKILESLDKNESVNLEF